MISELLLYIRKLTDVYTRYYDNDKRHEAASKLWTDYYKKSKEYGITLDEAYNFSLMYENESYIINQPPIRYEIDEKKVQLIVNKLKAAISINAEEKTLKNGITRQEAEVLLKWSVENTRKIIQKLTFNLERNSLNGFCELGQALSILPFENIGVQVTKNRASICFGYPFNHSFGTVTLPIEEENKVFEQPYLIDITYRQFFSTVRCNEGRYYAKDENYDLETAPDPGYFVEDKEFAKELMGRGFVELNEVTAKKYGEPFYLSSLKLGEEKDKNERNYFMNITELFGDYSINLIDVDSFDYNFPGNNDIKKL